MHLLAHRLRRDSQAPSLLRTTHHICIDKSIHVTVGPNVRPELAELQPHGVSRYARQRRQPQASACARARGGGMQLSILMMHRFLRHLSHAVSIVEIYSNGLIM
jgi:hypothetical protein